MSLTIIRPRKRPPTLPTLKRPLPSMTPQMAPLMKTPRKPLPTQFTSPRRRRIRLLPLLTSTKRILLIRRLRMKKLPMFLQIFVRREPEFSDRAVRKGAAEWSVMTMHMLLARTQVFESFVEIETCWASAFEVFVTVERDDFFGRGEGF